MHIGKQRKTTNNVNYGLEKNQIDLPVQNQTKQTIPDSTVCSLDAPLIMTVVS